MPVLTVEDVVIEPVNEWAARCAGEWEGPFFRTWSGNAGWWLCEAVKGHLSILLNHKDELHWLARETVEHYVKEKG
jgi:hypothetical protein